MPSADLFTITPDADYCENLLVKVHLVNAAELAHVYKHFNMKITCDGAKGEGTSDHGFELLTLENAEVLFDMESAWISPTHWISGTYTVTLSSGSYHVLPYNPLAWATGKYSVDPELWCEVQPR